VAAPATPETDASGTDGARSAQVSTWAVAIEAGVLARAARQDPDLPWRADATDEELRALEEAGARAQQEFVAANLGLVGSVLAGYTRGGAPAADLFQEGCLGLMAAVERFDHERGVRFSTYATYWIRARLSAASSRFTGAVTVPASRTDQLRTAHGVETALAQRLGRLPSVAEVAAALGRDERWTAALLAQRGARSLEELDDHALHRLSAIAVEAEEGPGPEPEVWARRLLATLTGFDRRVVELRLGFGGSGPASLASVARELGVPVGRVRRAELRALEQLRGRCPRAVAGAAS
jgi:RNA polymerase primary sigma factor